jgi:pentatricopeptide repeat protein
MMCGYVHHGHSLHAFNFFGKMNQEAVEPNKATYLYLLQACGDSGGILEGVVLHAHIIESSTIVDVVIGSSLIDMYTKCGGLQDAYEVFCRLSNKNVISWSAIIRGYSYHGHHFRSLELFERMQEEGIQPDKVTFLCILKAIGNLRMMVQGTLIHDQVILRGLESDVMIGNGLIHMYCSCGSFESACKVFDNMPKRDVVSWSAMITGHATHGNIEIAFGLFKRMQQERIKPDRVTLLCMAKACGMIGALELGKLMHDYIQHNEADTELAIGNALVDMYARCGSLEDSSRVFHKLMEPDVISWGAMIAGYAEHGSFCEAWECLQAMERQGLEPNGIMFTSILSACGRSGNIETGYLYFRLMNERYGILPSFEHVNCMGDLFGHAGCLEDAMKLFQCMPNQPDLTGWMSLLTACRTHGNREVGK